MKKRWLGLALVCTLLLSTFGAIVHPELRFSDVVGPDSSATLSVSPVENESEIENETVVEFDDLPPRQREIFERALENGHAEIESQSNWEYNWVVHYRDEYYSITIGIA